MSARPDYSSVKDGSIRMDDVPPTSSSSPKSTLAHTPIVFGFEGEYSIISLRETAAGTLGIGEMWKRIGRIVKEMERVTKLRFKYVFSNPSPSFLNLLPQSPSFLVPKRC